MTAAELSPAALLELLVGTPSVSREEGALADRVADLAEGWGYRVSRQGHNVWFSAGAGPRRLLLNSHLDTVPPCAGWTTDPLRPEWRQGRLYGLGANDAKGCVAALLLTARALAGQGGAALGGEVVFALTAEEENGGQGLGTVLPALGRLDAAVVGEPTGLAVCTAQRGMLLLRCTAHGKSGHVAHAERAGAQNAVHAAARDIVKLSGWALPAHPLLGATHAQVTTVQGGLTRNQVPDTCEFFVDVRTPPGVDHAALARELSGALESEVAVHSARYLPKGTPEAAPVVRAALAAAGAGAAPVGSNTASDWAFLGEVPAVKAGPGDTLRSHRPDEFLALSELEAGASFYRALVARYFEEAARG